MRSIGAIALKANSILFLLLALCSCGRTVMHNYGSSIGSSWQHDEAVLFQFDGNARGYRNLELSVEAIATASYCFKNLAISAEYLTASDCLLGCDTFHIEVFDNEGRRKGATAGLLYQLRSAPVLVEFPVNDTIFIRLKHLMGVDSVKGLTDVGVRISGSL